LFDGVPNVDCSVDLAFAATYGNDAGGHIAVMNVLFKPTEIPQASARKFGQDQIAAVDEGGRQGFEVAAKSAGYTIIEWCGTKKQAINNTVAFLSEYRRSGPPSSGSARVQVVRVFD
jgi:hypothetical protein